MNVRTFLTFLALPVSAMTWTAMPAIAAQQPGATEKSDEQEIVCRRLEETGSLVKKTKVCLTRAQWRRSTQNHSKYAEELADGLRTKPGGR